MIADARMSRYWPVLDDPVPTLKEARCDGCGFRHPPNTQCLVARILPVGVMGEDLPARKSGNRSRGSMARSRLRGARAGQVARQKGNRWPYRKRGSDRGAESEVQQKGETECS